LAKSIEYLNPRALPASQGHYSPGAATERLIFVSGQLPDLAGPDTSFAAQVRSSLEKVRIVLEQAECGLSDLLKVTAYIVGIGRWDGFNAVYAEIMGGARPARTVVPVQELHHGYLVEIDAIAARHVGMA